MIVFYMWLEVINRHFALFNLIYDQVINTSPFSQLTNCHSFDYRSPVQETLFGYQNHIICFCSITLNLYGFPSILMPV